MTRALHGRVVLVTGASRGLGRALALEAGARGAHVLAVARTVGGLEELDDAVKAVGGAATLVPLDLTDDPALERLGAAIGGRWGRLDLWLHAATHAPPLAPAAHADPKDLDRAIALNARTPLRLIGALDRLLRAGPAGRAALLDDLHDGEPFWASYAASRAFARVAWESWAAETRKTRLRPVRALPPPMPTALRARFYPGEDRAGLTPCAAVAPRLLDALAAELAPGAVIDLRG